MKTKKRKRKPDPSEIHKNMVPTFLVSGGVPITVNGYACQTSDMIPFPIALHVGNTVVCMDGVGAKELIRLLLETL